MSDYPANLNNLIQQITTNIAKNNINGALKDSELLKTNLDALTKSGHSIATIIQNIKEASLIGFENIESLLNDPTCYVLTNTIKQNDGEEHLSTLYNHIEDERKFKRAIELFQSNLIQNKCLEMACTNDMQYETAINLMRKVMQLPNENLLNAFVKKLCAFEYPDISINHLMDIFLIEPHLPEFIASELVREAYVTSMETTLQREEGVQNLVQFSKFLFNDNISMELLHKCCQNFREFYNLIRTVITKYLNFIEQLQTEDGYLLWYFNNENLSGNIKFNDFARFICILASPTELSFSNEFLLFLKNSFQLNLLNSIFAKFQ